MTVPFSGSIAAAGVAGAVVNSLTTQDSQLLLEISPGTVPFVGATLVFEALPLGSTVWFPVAGVEQDNLSVALGTTNAPFSVTPDGVTLGFKFDLTGCSAFRVWAKALTSGTITVAETSGSFFSTPPSGAALNYVIQLAMLWQLSHLTFLLAQSDPVIASMYQQNPIIPPGLPATVWNANF